MIYPADVNKPMERRIIFNTKVLDKILTVLLIISITAASALTIYVITAPKKGEEFTEFYIIGPSGKAADYPTSLSVGEKGEVIVGVVNHEYEPVSYLFRVEIEKRTIGEKSFQLAHNETLEFPFMFTASEKGKKKLEFLLFKEGAATPYRNLHHWIDIQ